MSTETEAHDLLEEGAAWPSRDFDPSAPPRPPTSPRRAVAIVATVVVAALVVLAGVAIFAGGSSDGRRVVVRPAVRAPGLPPGWRPIDIPDAGLALAIPADWVRSEVAGVVLVGTSEHTTSLSTGGCGDGWVPGTWLALVEIEPGQPHRGPLTGIEVSAPGADLSRPADFRSASFTQHLECLTTSTVSTESARYEGYRFTDAGRLFFADIATVGPSDPDRVAMAKEVLNTVLVQPRTPVSPPDDGAAASTTTPSTTAPPTTSAPPTTASTAPPSTSLPIPGTDVPPPPLAVPVGADERAIADAFLGWLNANPRDAIGDYVEDFESIRATHDAGIAQWPTGSLGDVTGRVDHVTVVDDTHATVVYSILRGAEEWYTRRTGYAVKIDGRWMVSRDTVCDLLAVGGLTCPPRV